MSATILTDTKRHIETVGNLAARSLLQTAELERSFELLEEYIELLESQIVDLDQEVHALQQELREQEESFARTIDFDNVPQGMALGYDLDAKYGIGASV